VRTRSLTLLAETLLIGVLVCATAVFVVTALAAAAAGSVLLRELAINERTPTVRRYFALVGAAVRDPVAIAAPVVFAAVGGLDVVAVLGGLPGGQAYGLVLLVLLTGLLVTGLRAGAMWAPGEPWRLVLGSAVERTVLDWRGSVMLAVAVLAVVLVVAQAWAFVVIAPGLLVLAAVAVCGRRR